MIINVYVKMFHQKGLGGWDFNHPQFLSHKTQSDQRRQCHRGSPGRMGHLQNDVLFILDLVGVTCSEVPGTPGMFFQITLQALGCKRLQEKTNTMNK